MKPIPAIIFAPLIAHPVWALFMLFATQPLHTMGIDSTYQITPSPGVATLLMFAASGAAWLSHRDKWHGTILGFILIAPQQFLMLTSLYTIIVSVLTGAYPNGYAPPAGWRFIASDQIFFAVCCLLHSINVWQCYISQPKHE